MQMLTMRRGVALMHSVEHAAETIRNESDLQRFVAGLGSEADVTQIVVVGEKSALRRG